MVDAAEAQGQPGERLGILPGAMAVDEQPSVWIAQPQDKRIDKRRRQRGRGLARQRIAVARQDQGGRLGRPRPADLAGAFDPLV